MYVGKAVRSVWSVLGAAAVACTLCAGNAAANDNNVTVAIQLSTKGLDLNQPAAVREFYARLKHAADIVCTHGNRVDLEPAADPVRCHEKALGDAIRSANVPLLTQVYLETHTPRQAAAYGIPAPAQVAAQ